MKRYILTPEAARDLDEITSYVATDNPRAADRFAIKLSEVCDLHAAHPQIGEKADEYAPALRLFSVWNYAVFYRPNDDGIELIRIIHGARDIPQIFE